MVEPGDQVPPPPPPIERTPQAPYDPPSARRVVSEGLQLTFTASAAIRRASLYIGLLVLTALGPAIVLFFGGLARLLADPATADVLLHQPTHLLEARPDLEAPLDLFLSLVIAGFVLLVAISIDAQAIAISTLASVASKRPLSLAEAVTRARQTFWRLLGAALIVGLVSAIVSFAVSIPFGGVRANTGVSFIASMVGALVVTPWAYAGAGIVLGDVGAVESLRRSVALFRAGRTIALVVVLFTLVTAAIQSFALDTGAGLVARAGELFGLRLDEGALSLVLPAILVLAFAVALGSLIFTIAAIVAGPQVVAFLGLTFYSGGLDRARSNGPAPRGLLHWVSLPYAIVVLVMALVALSTLASIAPS